MKLFEIAEEFRLLKEIAEADCEYDEETGEVIDNYATLSELFDSIQMKLEEKLEASAYTITELESVADALKLEAKRLNERANRYGKNADYIKSIMLNAVNESGLPKIKTDKFTFSKRKSVVVEIDPLITPDDFSREYVRIKREIDKTKVKDALKRGELITGASLQEREHLQIK